ncbi:MAG: glycoside hydrolase family 130 protein, partial [Planctomycetota bacterium]
MRTSQPIPVLRGDQRLLPDPRRVLARPHIAAWREVFRDGGSHAKLVLRRLLEIPPEEVGALVDEVWANYGHRHRDLKEIFATHFEVVSGDLPDDTELAPEQRLLIGAYFTMEYSVESAALFNPSIVPAPDQSGVPAGSCRIVVSLRAVGEGHISSIEFRSGVVDGEGGITFDTTTPFLGSGQRSYPWFSRQDVRVKAVELGADPDVCGRLLKLLRDPFGAPDLDAAVRNLERTEINRALAYETVKLVRLVIASNYEVKFPTDSILSERILVPAGPRETQGMEDARFVRFVDEAGRATYFATYTAFDGFSILPQLIETTDFKQFRISTLSGRYARNKGPALFPRHVNGRYAMLARHDQQSLHLMYSDDVRVWDESHPLLGPRRPWGMVKIGNCGSPLETPEGWLVLTHGVGPLREYS